MTQNFKRENRYIVFKAKDLECLDTFSQFVLSELCKRVAEVRTQRGKDGLECVVIESDWPEYETVWKMIEARMTGNAAASDVDEDTAKRFRGLLSMLGISAPESDESLMLCQFSFLGMVRHKIQQIYDQPSRTAELEKLLETEGLRLAACSTAALGYFEGCADEFKSASLDDVLRLRASHAELEDKVKRLVEAGNEYFASRDDYDSVDCPGSAKFSRLDSARDDLKSLLAEIGGGV